MISKDGVTARIQQQLLGVSDPRRRAAIQAALIDPREDVVEWSSGDTLVAFRCWIIGSIPARDLELAYCDPGSGPLANWGALLRRGAFGEESEWYRSLDRAFDAYFGGEDSGW